MRQIKNLDGKFGVMVDWGAGTMASYVDVKLVNLVSLEAIPDDEPIFILRARDIHAVETLEFYRKLSQQVENRLHDEGMRLLINTFNAFRNQHPDRMKQPTSSMDLKLENI